MRKELERQPAKNVGIWIRVSTEDQARGESPEHHEKRALAYAEARAWNVREVYHLEAVSGKSVMEHPETERMLRDIKSGRVSALIFSKLARLARNTRELLEFSDIFRDHGADLISLQEAIDTSTPAGRLFFTIIAAMAQWEREEISERVAASVPIRAQLGKPVGGQAPFGYQWQNRQLVPHPDEAPIRRRIYELFMEHHRKKTVARILNEAGYRTRTGSKFSDTTIDRLIRDPVAKGLRRSNYTKSLGDKKHWRLKSDDEWVFSQVDPIVTEEVWHQCNSILDEKRNGRKPTRKTVHLFSGYAYCGCGQKLYVPSSNPKYTCYKCHNKIGLEDLETVFQEQLKTFFFSPTDWLNYLEQADGKIKEKQELMEALDRERQKIAQDMEKLFKLYMSDQISPEGFGKQNKPLEERAKQLEEEIPQLQGEIDFMKIHYLSSDQILTNARDLYSRWPELKAEERRKIVENITERIVIGKEDVTIELAYLPSPSEIASKEQRTLMDSLPRPA